MLIRNINPIKMMPNINKKGYYTYVSKQVFDAEGTAKAREACTTNWNNKISELNDLMTECRTHINQIKSLQTEIADKVSTLNTFDTDFNTVQNYVDKANINFDLIEDNKKCMERLKNELATMDTNCTTQLAEWKQKYDDAKIARKDAMLEKKNCSSISKYKTVVEQVWVQ